MAAPPPPPTATATPSSTTPATPSPDADIAARVAPIFAAYKTDPSAPAPGCGVEVLRAGEVLFARGYGYANLEHEIPITPTTSFEIGSMSKQFAATAILLLAEDGKLSVEDDVRKYVPELPVFDRARPVTLRHLLHHTGGLREYDALLGLSGFGDVDGATEAEALRLLSLQKGTNFAPGSVWSYSNTGYFLLAVVVERVSGQSLAAFSKERIFDPLGMKDTTIFDDRNQVVRHHATGYSPREAPRDGFRFRSNMSGREMTGEGNVQTTLADLARWDANFYEPKVGGKTWLSAMRTPGKRSDGTPIPYSMGLHLAPNHGFAEEEHSGGWAGYLSDWRRYPEARMSFLVLCNRDDVDPNGLTDAMARALLPVAQGSQTTAQADADQPWPAIPTPDLSPFIGAYIEPKSLLVRTFAARDGALQIGFALEHSEVPPRTMEAIAPSSFRTKGARSRWTFEPASGKKPARVTRTAAGEDPVTLERFVPEVLDASKLAAYVGRYESAETTGDFEIVVKDGKLQASPWGRPHQASTLAGLSRDTFATTDGGLGIAFARNGAGKVVGMTFVFGGYPAVKWTKR